MNEFTHKGKNKKEFVKYIFNDISTTYDFLNHFLSLGIDIIWRKKFIKSLGFSKDDKVLDVATGTGDVAFAIKKKYKSEIIGLDLSINMLDIAKKKSKKMNAEDIVFMEGDAENLPFDDNAFNKLVISYGLRNLGDCKKGLEEFYRVLKPNSKIGILEFLHPKSTIISKLFKFYFNNILPRVASLFSNSKAYRYLPESVENFMTPNELKILLEEVGFKNVSCNNLTFGITTIVNAEK
ncbi:MAG: bifunctional demethylmenaquinone methyltransferase/2-methoxy-6-polyprenyl-1,4-benzoquinol methylase UbiE [Candidatus Marinimicrobia bacterium]|nr:bifunctional demethylmenaquinone methyltransferase/2-methoxy-6-polyprenyl-1,4-benzoquinol methylase UbiE [Candidatus Neomarinimicrobiota bacterium]|tara:strand:- start:60 stop:770 length:711 start_codon:yes stop_codon:yes gene_type:complete